jgi:ribosomal protein L16 Arg81 hydroxylase
MFTETVAKQQKYSLQLNQTIDRVEASHLTRKIFTEKYLKPQIPLVIKGLLKNDPCYTKWTINYFKQLCGNEQVGYFDKKNDKIDRSYKQPHGYIKFADYLDEIVAGPSDKRLFLFDVFKLRPELKKDFSYPNICGGFIKIPFTFFGGQSAVTRLHQDIDMSNVFLTQFHGRKRVVLFHPDDSAFLYRFAFNTHTPIDVANPDFEKFPALKYVNGWDITLQPGETLFMPGGFWHYIEYTDGGFSMSFRSIAPNWDLRFKGLMNVAVKTHIDELLLKLRGKKWFEWKEKQAFLNAEAAMQKKQNN